MAKKLYTNPISEFIDWISGIDSFTKRTSINTENDGEISGQSIRNLIQDHLKKPFYVYDDQGKINPKQPRKWLFSSELAYQRWMTALIAVNNQEDKLAEEYKKLVLLEFEIPSPNTIYILGEDGAQFKSNINILEGSNNKGLLSFRVYLNDRTSPTYTPCIAKLQLKDNLTGQVIYTDSKNIEASQTDGIYVHTFDLSDKLKSGANPVKLEISTADNTNAKPAIVEPVINLITYNIDIQFKGNRSFNNECKWDPTSGSFENISFDIVSFKTFSKSVKQNLYIYVDDFSKTITAGPIEISGWETQQTSVSYTIQNNYSAPTDIEGPNSNVKHKVFIYGEIIDESDLSATFRSNSIYFEFENASIIDGGINNNYINILSSIPASSFSDGNNKYLLAYQYNKFELRWGYYTDSQGTNVNPSVTWILRMHDNSVAGQDYKDIIITSLGGTKGVESEPLSFIPDNFTYDPKSETPFNENNVAKLIATIVKNGNTIEIFEQPIVIVRSTYQLAFDEHGGYALKLNAYGRSNQESLETKNVWKYVNNVNTYETIFSENFPWDSNNGWDNNSLSLSGEHNFAEINFVPFRETTNNKDSIPSKGLSIEIDFMPTNVSNSNDVLAKFGDESAGCIKIYPTKASVLVNNTELVSTNYKANERIQLMFIFTPRKLNEVGSANIYIVNNGILERGVGGNSYYDNLSSNRGNIKLGGTNSGIKIYNIRIWESSMSIYNAFLNYLYDCENKGTIISRNTMVESRGQDMAIRYAGCTEKIDTFLITGNIDNILNAGTSKKDSESAVNIQYMVPNNDYLGWPNTYNVKIRKHGQSTLNYPLTSFKIWLNKSKGDTTPMVQFNNLYNVQNDYVKNRYTIRENSIPSNKFVLQANYADSSGVHNGGLLRLINDTWYNANFGTSDNPIYRLRTWPQLFASGQTVTHNDTSLGENGWVEGYGNTDEIFGGLVANEHTWPQLAKALKGLETLPTFPYKIRNAPDSRPCVVFYKKTDNSEPTYLGQFVFMDDKKSDHIYGERSIYLWDNINDPFCMTNEGANASVKNKKGEVKKGYDRDQFCVWENKNVLRIECVLVNSTLTSFMNFNVAESIEYYTKADEQAGIIPPDKQVGDPKTDGTGTIPADTVKSEADNITGIVRPVNYYWEDYFEMIFPDDEDITDDDAENNLTKFSGHYKTLEERNDPNFKWPKGTSKFIKKTQPWIDFLHWMCEIGQLNVKANGEHNIDGTVTTAALNKFIAEASEHLDLYKLAAYYIFYIRFGLVDSVERNAQYKTYDGIHWFLEPWDMDIALGNKNTGGLVYDPPLTRDTRMPGNNQIWAYSGRSKTTSNVLWDCLEAWDEWMNTIVPKVSDALYAAGLTYENVSNMFDEEYANKWSEVLYNYSGMYKYVTAAQDPGWLSWLQGSRTSHRHWWLSTSMNYYDSKWTSGKFNQSRIYLAVNKAMGDEITIKLGPTSETYFKLTQKDTTTNLGLKEAWPGHPAEYNLTNESFTAKDPTHIFGVLFLEELRLGKFAQGIEKMIFQNAVDPILGATIKLLDIGSTIPTEITQNTVNWVNGADISITNTVSISNDAANSNLDALENVETINITGQLTIGVESIINNTRTRLKNIYAAGSGFKTLSSADQGNKFNVLQLPAHNNAVQQDNSIITTNGVTSFVLNNTSWEDISFWDCTYTANTGWIVTGSHEEPDPEDPTKTTTVIDKEYVEQTVTYNELDYIPETFQSVNFMGSTASNACSARFILQWLDSIEHYVRQANPGLSGDELETAILNYIDNNQKRAYIEQIRWNYNVDPTITVNGETKPNPNYINITYKDIIRLAHLGGGIAQNGQSIAMNNFTGYIKITDNTPMTAFQLAELIKYFGENVFTIGNINNSLVIDQALSYAKISVSGDDINLNAQTGNIEVIEDSLIKFRCTSFLLSTEDASSYEWFVDGANTSFSDYIGDGAYYAIKLCESIHNGVYDITIMARNINDNNIQTSITLKVTPVKVCRSWEFKWVTGQAGQNLKLPRKYAMDEAFALNLFGENIYNQIPDANGNLQNVLCDTYIFYESSMLNELYIAPTDTYTAKLKNIVFTFANVNEDFTLSRFANGDAGNGWNGKELTTNRQDYDPNSDDPNSNYNYIILDNNYLAPDRNTSVINIKRSATKSIHQENNTFEGITVYNGIVFETCNSFANKTNTMQIFKVTATIYHESTDIAPQQFKCFIIMYNDAQPIINTARGSGLAIRNKLMSDYPNGGYTSNTSTLYKTDLISLKGTLSFAEVIGENKTDIGTLKALTGFESLFDFMPNVEHIDISNTTYQFDELDNYFDFTKLKLLRTLKLSNASSAVTTITTTGHNRIEEIWLNGTNINLHAENNNSLRLVKLGDPRTVYFDLGTTNKVFDITNFTCDGSTRLQSLDIINNSTTNTYAYKLFDKIYNPVEETPSGDTGESGATGETGA